MFVVKSSTIVLISVLFSCFLPNFASSQDSRKTQPNIIFIITDDQSWDSLGFMGGKVYTPRIDRMAKEGMYLTDFNVTSTVCSPSRYTFLTGRYAGRCEGEKFLKEHPPGDQTQVENIGELELNRWNLAKVLQKNGYKTGFVGKSHLVRHDILGKFENRSSDLEELQFYPPNADPRDPEINSKLQKNHEFWCNEIQKYGFDYADGIYAANLRELYNEALNVHNIEWTVSKAFQFLEKYQNEPFFLYFSTTLHHGPSPWEDEYGLGADIRMTGEGFVEEGFDVMPSRKSVIERTVKAGFKKEASYALWLDDGVGAIIDKVKQLGLEKDTLIVFVPDHGSYRHGKTTLHEYGMRVPMLLQWEGKIKEGSKYDQILANIDFAPTILDLCSIEMPTDYLVDGYSFKNVLFGSQDPLRDALFCELGHSRGVKTKKWKYIAIRYPERLQEQIDQGKTFKGFKGEDLELPYLTRNAHLGYHAALVNPNYFVKDQLYNLVNDIEENNNVFKQNPETAEQMKKFLSVELSKFKGRPFGEFTTDN
ncbi:MAG: sulfatase-like hydrolase/transferase [Bacteroidota bacterium]